MLDKNTFAKTLRILLEYSKKRNGKTTQQQLAQFLGVSKQAVSLYCKGESLPNCYQLLKIAQFFGVSTDYLLTGIKPENKSTHDELGLSDEAIERLKYLRNDKEIGKRLIHLLNALLSERLMPFVNALLGDKNFSHKFFECLDFVINATRKFAP